MMLDLEILAGRVRKLTQLLESNPHVDVGALADLNGVLHEGTELIKRGNRQNSIKHVVHYRNALEELSACLRRCDSRLSGRRLLLVNQLRHLRNVNQWARGSADTI